VVVNQARRDIVEEILRRLRMSTQQALLIDPWLRETIRIELVDPDEALLKQLLRCEKLDQYDIFEEPDGGK
jgi:hypothetical protein